MDFGDTREVLLIGPWFMCYENRNASVLTKINNRPLETHDQMVENSWVFFSVLDKAILV